MVADFRRAAHDFSPASPCTDAQSFETAMKSKYGETVEACAGAATAPPSRRTAEDQRRIGAAKSERIRQHHADVALARLMRHQIDRRLDRRVVEIERRRRDAVAHRQDREDR